MGAGVRWVVTQRGFGFVLPMAQYVTLRRAAEELTEEALPWEDADDLRDLLIFARKDKDGCMRVVVPGRLYPSLKEALTLAKDSCTPGLVREFVWLLEQVEDRNEARSAIDRLGDLGA